LCFTAASLYLLQLFDPHTLQHSLLIQHLLQVNQRAEPILTPTTAPKRRRRRRQRPWLQNTAPSKRSYPGPRLTGSVTGSRCTPSSPTRLSRRKLVPSSCSTTLSQNLSRPGSDLHSASASIRIAVRSVRHHFDGDIRGVRRGLGCNIECSSYSPLFRSFLLYTCRL